jgi:hypothetical protein
LDKKSPLATIRATIKKYNIVPDIKCLRLACKHSAYNGVIKYLVTECKLEPDFICLRNCMQKQYQHFILNNMRNKYFKDDKFEDDESDSDKSDSNKSDPDKSDPDKSDESD